MDIDDLCKGCSTEGICLLSPMVKYKDKPYECPCQTCLVKMICRDQCTDFSMYFNLYHAKVEPILAETYKVYHQKYNRRRHSIC